MKNLIKASISAFMFITFIPAYASGFIYSEGKDQMGRDKPKMAFIYHVSGFNLGIDKESLMIASQNVVLADFTKVTIKCGNQDPTDVPVASSTSSNFLLYVKPENVKACGKLMIEMKTYSKGAPIIEYDVGNLDLNKLR